MLKVTTKFEKIELDVKSFRKVLGVEMRKLLEDGMRVWLNEVINRVPVLTGQARASLEPLAAFLGVTIPITPTRTDAWARRRLAEGPSMGRQSEFIRVDSNPLSGPFRFVVKWDTEVPHWQFLEEGSHPKVKSAPWFALSIANIALANFIEKTIPLRIPNVSSFIRTSTSG